jgi:hypothetical protein
MGANHAVVAAASIVGFLIAVTPAGAAQQPPPVATVSVSSVAERPAHPRGTNFSPLVVVSWTGEDPAVNGVVACLTRGTTPSYDARSCDVRQDVPAPGTRTGQLKLRPQASFAIAVFTYTEGSARTYSSPQTTVWHGSVFHGQGAHIVTFGQRVRLAATLHDVNTAGALAGQPIALLFAPGSSDSLRQVAKLTTDSNGQVTKTFQPRERGDYFWVYDGGDGHLPVSLQTTVYLAYRMTAHLTSGRAAPGQAVKLYGVIKPAATNTTKTVRLYEYANSGPCKGFYTDTGEHVTAKQQTLPNGQTAFGYTMTISRATVGTHKFETGIATDKRLDGGFSPSVALTIGSATVNRGYTRSGPATPAC